MKTNHAPIDTYEGESEYGLYNTLPEGITQEDIDAIAKWSILYNEKCRQNNERVQWPNIGEWPHWPDITYNELVVKCCSDETGKKRELSSNLNRVNLAALKPHL